MKKLAVYLLPLLFASFIFSACSKSGGGGGNSCNETPVKFTSTPALNSTESPAPGPDFALTVNVSPLPAAGVTITVTAKPENPSTATAFYTQTVNSTTAANNFTITGTPLTTTAIVTITVISKSCESNKMSGTYRYSRK